MRGAVYLILWILAIYTAIGVYLYAFQNRFVYFPNIPSRDLMAQPDEFGLPFEEQRFVTPDGVELHGWYIHAESPRGVVLFFHGNAGNISHRFDSIAVWRELGYDVFIFDYRGYGLSDGKPSEQGTYLDGQAAWDLLVQERGIDPRAIVVFGRSLGAAIATHTAAANRPAVLVLESAFSSVKDMAGHYYPWLPVRWIARLHYDTGKKISAVEAPVLVIHSSDDEIIPVRFGQKVFESAAQPKEFLEIFGDHNAGFLLSGSRYRDGLKSFVDKYHHTDRESE